MGRMAHPMGISLFVIFAIRFNPKVERAEGGLKPQM
jgi:hypothetical protein